MAGWQVVEESSQKLLCWLMVIEMIDNSSADSGVALLDKQSENQTNEWPCELWAGLPGWFLSYHTKLILSPVLS